jgi:glucan phosphoethanolaminetransferase (alkaline phosphatase superfamily)
MKIIDPVMFMEAKTALMIELIHSISLFLVAGFFTSMLGWIIMPRPNDSTEPQGKFNFVIIIIGLLLYFSSAVFFVRSLSTFGYLFLLTI